MQHLGRGAVVDGVLMWARRAGSGAFLGARTNGPRCMRSGAWEAVQAYLLMRAFSKRTLGWKLVAHEQEAQAAGFITAGGRGGGVRVGVGVGRAGTAWLWD